MKRWIIIAALSLPMTAEAKVIEDACLEADRAKATRDLCSCIQRVADQMLTRSDQNEAATFFENPQLAQDTRMSDNPQKEKFWERYKDWSESASKICS